MTVELLDIDGTVLAHTVVPIIGDGACLFRAISYLLYDTQVMAREVREEIVSHVVANWEEFAVMSHNRNGDNYSSSAEYCLEMSRPFTYGSLCELVAAYSVEWQKRGLPHIHILLWLEQRITPDKIDNVICAEIPDPEQDPLLYAIVKAHMIHGPCGGLNYKSPCMKDKNCTKRYPRPLHKDTQTGDDGYPQYRRRSPDDGGHIIKMNELELDNRWVVPYNPVLLRTFIAHINVELCNSVKAIKYIYKYVNKGSDQAALTLENENDEVKIYESGRYISSSEAVWRILKFPIHERFPPVIHLAVYLENGQRVYFTSDNLLERINRPPQTTLLAFFEICKTDNFAKTLSYSEVPSYFVWDSKKFTRRKRGKVVKNWPGVKKDHVLGRVYTVKIMYYLIPSNGMEWKVLRLLAKDNG